VNKMNCEQWFEPIGDLVDGAVAESARERVEAHLSACDECRALAADMRRIREAAGGLPRLQPPDRVWVSIRARLEQQAPVQRRSWRRSVAGVAPSHWRFGLALAALLALVAASTILLLQFLGTDGRSGTVRTAVGVHPQEEAIVQSVENDLKQAEELYLKAIAGLEQLALARRDALEPEVAATLERNLAIIDVAISESRAAVRSQPDSRLAQESLFEAFRRKVALLQDTVLLINEMRKGDSAETARLIEALNKS
jgi:hypothetical protein